MIKQVPISKIKITENHRTNIESTHLDELMHSIKQHGLMQPVGLAPSGRGGYVLRFGQRRFLACRKLGHKTISAIISGSISEEKLLLENLTENMQRRDPSFAELGRVIEKLERKLNLSTAQIAVRLGLSPAKIAQILEVYNLLPEKYRKRVMFMEKGGGRKARKGCIPASVATRIVKLRKDHGLKEKDIDLLFKNSSDDALDAIDMDNVSSLISAGMSIKAALTNIRDYRVHTIDVAVRNDVVAGLMEKYGLVNKRHLFLKAIYGEVPPLPKPDFISTGVRAIVKKTKKPDMRPFVKMRGDLMKLARKGKLTDDQQLALTTTQGLAPGKWTDAQCQQLQRMCKEIIDK